MGYYIEVPRATDKAQQIVDIYGAVRITSAEAKNIVTDPSSESGVVCVIENGSFDAAAYVYSLNEYAEFSHPDDYRPRTWLKLPKELAQRLSGYTSKATTR